jgi:alkylation response protein AidB-like acyl-CoA dehydrogenase
MANSAARHERPVHDTEGDEDALDRPWLAPWPKPCAPFAPTFAEREAADPERYPADNIADLVASGVMRAPFPESAGGVGCTLLATP